MSSLIISEPVFFTKAKYSGNSAAYIKGFGAALVELAIAGDFQTAAFLMEKSELSFWHFQEAGVESLHELEIVWRSVSHSH